MYIISEASEVMEQIQAQEDLRMIQVVSFPDFKKEDREKMFKQLNKKAYPEMMKPKAVTSADLARLLGRGP